MKITHLIVSFRIKSCYRTFAVWKQLLLFLCHCPDSGQWFEHPIMEPAREKHVS